MRAQTIEQTLMAYLLEKLDVPVNYRVPSGPPDLYVIIQKTGSSRDHGLWTATFAVQSVGKDLLEVMLLNDDIKTVLPDIVEEDDIFRCECQGDYDFTNLETKESRYQAVFEIVYKGV